MGYFFIECGIGVAEDVRVPQAILFQQGSHFCDCFIRNQLVSPSHRLGTQTNEQSFYLSNDLQNL